MEGSRGLQPVTFQQRNLTSERRGSGGATRHGFMANSKHGLKPLTTFRDCQRVGKMSRVGHKWGFWIVKTIFMALALLMLKNQALGLDEFLPKKDLPSAPSSGIYDPDGYFKSDPESQKRISERLQKLSRERGYQIYLVVQPTFIGATVAERAAELRQAWSPDGNGLVIYYEVDSRNLGIDRDLSGGSGSANNTAAGVPSYQTTAILKGVMDSISSISKPQAGQNAVLEAITTRLVDGFEAYFASRAVKPSGGRNLRIGLLVLGVLAVFALAAMLLVSVMRHGASAPIQRYRFPVVDRPERLGAADGSAVTTHRFS